MTFWTHKVNIEHMSSTVRNRRRFPPGSWTGRILLAAAVLILLWLVPKIFLGTKAPVVRAERRTLAQKVVANGRVYVPVRAQLRLRGVTDILLADYAATLPVVFATTHSQRSVASTRQCRRKSSNAVLNGEGTLLSPAPSRIALENWRNFGQVEVARNIEVRFCQRGLLI